MYNTGMRVTRLKQLRTSRLLTQGELADKSGVAQNRISQMELGMGARRKTIEALAKALGVEPSELVQEKE